MTGFRRIENSFCEANFPFNSAAFPLTVNFKFSSLVRTFAFVILKAFVALLLVLEAFDFNFRMI